VRTADLARLISLAAIWGGSFLFMRIASPALGALVTADARLLIGGGALALYLWFTGAKSPYRGRAKTFALVGMVNSGVPFAMFSIAALWIPASYSAVLNALAPLFGALFLWLLERERLTGRKTAGIALGPIGVALMSRLGPIPLTTQVVLGILACVLATVCYGWAGVLIRRHARDIPSMHSATGTQLAAGAILLPLALGQAVVAPPPQAIALGVIAATLALGVLCSGVAYVLYFRLMTDLGPTRALTVTYVIPVFGMLWAAIFLGESITAGMLLGAALVVAGTVLVLR
jgi:drug/metabolite transporter (DMT)-like permease